MRRVERLEAREGLRFEEEVLRQFSGPSFTVLRPGPDRGGCDVRRHGGFAGERDLERPHPLQRPRGAGDRGDGWIHG